MSWKASLGVTVLVSSLSFTHIYYDLLASLVLLNIKSRVFKNFSIGTHLKKRFTLPVAQALWL